MSEIVAQASFNSGEWSPNLYARVDLQKYKSGAALLENFFVDYRGGASSRPGSKYIIQAYDSANQVRLIRFQASFTVGYILEFGNGYIRFIYNGTPVTETGINITGATQANPCVVSVVNSYSVGDWVYITNVVGMTQLNGRYFRVGAASAGTISLQDLNGVDINSTTYTAYSSGGTVARIYKISSPYTMDDDLRQIKFAQSTSQMILCHPNHPPYVLTLISATNWTMSPVAIGATISAPAAPTITTTLGAGNVNYAYVVTAIDGNGQESSPSTPGTLASILDIRTNAGTNTITWTAVAGAVAYNVYEAVLSYGAAVPSGAQYGFIGTTRGLSLKDTNIGPDFSQTPPISQQPFTGYSVTSVTVTAPGTYTTVPTVTFVGTASAEAIGSAVLTVQGTPAVTPAAFFGYAVNDLITFSNGFILRVTALDLSVPGTPILTWAVANPGSVTSGSTPSNPMSQISTTGSGTGAQASPTWGVGSVTVSYGGLGYLAVPSVSFSAGAATATAVLGSAASINPTVPGFVQQRLIFANTQYNPATFWMSKPGSYYNFDISNPAVASDSVQGTLVSGTLNTIKSVIGTAAGMVLMTDQGSWVVNGGSPGSAITAINAVANPQSYIGANDLPPIIANFDILFVQAKGAAVRDLSYNFYLNVYTGVDISLISSHLFYGYTIDEWAWAEQPFYLAQCIRSDGKILSLTFLKEQEFIGWSHFETDGLYSSIASVTEIDANNFSTDTVYTVVDRTINGNAVKYIERFVDRKFTNGRTSAWCVDAGLQYNGAPATTFTGAEHLAGETVTGLADGEIITPFVMPTSGFFTLPSAASVVTVGKAFRCRLQTLALDLGEPSIQGKVKNINSVNIKVVDTLNLKIGSDFTSLVQMKDLRVGNVSSTLVGQPSQIITDLVTGDARTFLDPTYVVPGQYCFEQTDPYPASILGVFPSYNIGDTGR